MRNKWTAICGIVTAMAMTTAVHAIPITGGLSMGALVDLNTADVTTATTVESWPVAWVAADYGDFGSISPMTFINMTAPWVFKPYQPPFGLPNNPQFTWSVGGFTFTMISDSVTTGGNFLDVTGYGTITGNGYTPTPFDWNFSTETLPLAVPWNSSFLRLLSPFQTKVSLWLCLV